MTHEDAASLRTLGPVFDRLAHVAADAPDPSEIAWWDGGDWTRDADRSAEELRELRRVHNVQPGSFDRALHALEIARKRVREIETRFLSLEDEDAVNAAEVYVGMAIGLLREALR